VFEYLDVFHQTMRFLGGVGPNGGAQHFVNWVT